MKRGLVIVANYDPNPSSVAICIRPLISTLSKMYNIDILTDRTRVDVLTHEIKENVNIYRVDDYRKMNTFLLNDLMRINSSFILKLITKIVALILKALYYVRYVLSAVEKNTGGWEIKRVVSKFKELNAKHKYDFIISVSLPFQSHYIAEKIKDDLGDSIKWLVFEFDPFSYNYVIKANSRLRKKMRNDEERVFKKCDRIILTPELYEFYKRENFITDSLISKVNMLNYANVEPIHYEYNNVSQNYMNDNGINCFFAGRLYRDIRNPGTLLDLFSKINKNIHLIMMTNYSLEEIREFTPSSFLPSVIPFQNRDTALYNLEQADILINIGNTVEFQVPAKIFEYMSTGKPIIHFSKIKNDPALKYLKHYPKVLIVNEWEVETHNYKLEIENFCEKNKNFKLSFEQVNECLGEYSGKAAQEKFVKIVKEMLGDN